ncbi:MAG: S8 family serine peptidase, partial [Planctomycetota bacterium]|nr:S8 family serine peptidase [Planctomycetota bacterium]
MLSSILFSLFSLTFLAGQQPAELHWTDLGFDRGVFQIADLEAFESAAVRLNDDLALKSGRVPAPIPGYTLAGRVIVQTVDGGALAALTDGLGASSCDPLADLPDFWLVDAGSVGAALMLREALASVYGQSAVYLDARRPWAERLPSDPGFTNQWHLRNTVNPLFDANVEGAWNAGYTGQGVVIGIIDGGIYVGHPDLDGNYNATASQSGSGSSHGTSCAGVAAAEEGNGQGGVGAAYDAQWSSMYYGFSSQNASSFAHRNDLNDIKSNSWGPADNGTLAYWTTAESAAIQTAAT